MVPSIHARSATSGVYGNKAFTICVVVAIAMIDWRKASLQLKSLSHDDLYLDSYTFPSSNLDSASLAGNSSNASQGAESMPRWTGNITEFPPFMMQWPTDTFGPDQCNILNTSIPYIFNITDYPTSYDLGDVFGVVHGNLTEAWHQAEIAAKEGNRTNGDVPQVPDAPSNQIKTVACSLIDYSVISQFPHQMQHIYPCWSLWRHFPGAKHFFFLRPKHLQGLLTGSVYNAGITNVLRANNISIVPMTMKNFVRQHRSDASELLVAYSHRVGGYRSVSEGDMQDLGKRALTSNGLDVYTKQGCDAAHRDDKLAASPPAAFNDEMKGKSGSSEYSNPLHPPRIAIANRRDRRRLLGAHNVSILLQDEFGLPYSPPVFFLEDMTFKQQVEAFASIDILLTPHGAQLTSVPFMPHCSSLVEVLPRAYDWNEFFGTLAAISGVNHSYKYLGTDVAAETEPLRSSQGQEIARSTILCAPADPMIEAVRIQMHRWQECCGFAWSSVR